MLENERIIVQDRGGIDAGIAASKCFKCTNYWFTS